MKKKVARRSARTTKAERIVDVFVEVAGKGKARTIFERLAEVLRPEEMVAFARGCGFTTPEEDAAHDRALAGSRPVTVTKDSLERFGRVAAALGIPHGARTPTQDAALSVAVFAATAVAEPLGETVFGKTLERMADLAAGAAKPGDTFGAEVLSTIMVVDVFCSRHPSPAEHFLEHARLHLGRGFQAKLLQGLDSQAALALLRKSFGELARNKSRKPVGVVVDLIHAAVHRGVDFGRGANMTRTTTRAQIAKLVTQMQKRDAGRTLA